MKHDGDKRRRGILHGEPLHFFAVVLQARQHRLQDAAGAEGEFLAAVIDKDIVRRLTDLEAGKLRLQPGSERLGRERLELAVGGRELAGFACDQLPIREQDDRAFADPYVQAADHSFAAGVGGRDCLFLTRCELPCGQVDAIRPRIDVARQSRRAQATASSDIANETRRMVSS